MKFSSRGLFGTVLIHILVLLLLIFFGFSYPDPPPAEQGILINFGTDQTGLGNVEPAGAEVQGGNKETSPAKSEPEPVIKEKTVKVEETTPKNVVDKNVQNFEESPVKANTPTPEELKQKEIERLKKEELKIQKAEEERKRELAEKWSNKGQAAFGNKGVGTTQGSEGITQGAGNQGNPNGTPGADNYGEGIGLGNGIRYGLGNRTGEIPRPVDKCVVTSRVIIKVQIIVDREGNVVGTPRVIESNFQDNCIYEAIIQAASKAKFNADANAAPKQIGWIRYIYEP